MLIDEFQVFHKDLKPELLFHQIILAVEFGFETLELVLEVFKLLITWSSWGR